MSGKRLIVVVPTLEMGGTERQVILLAQGLARLAPRLAEMTTVVTLRDGGTLQSELPSEIACVTMGAKSMIGLRTIWRLRSLVKQRRADVVYSLLVPANIVSAIATMGTSTRLYWGHRSQFLSQGSSMPRVAVARLSLSGLRHFCSGAICNSAAAAEFLRSIGFRKDTISVIHNAVDTSRFFPDPLLGARQRQQMGMTDDDKVILSVGRLVADKDYPTLLRAFELVLRSEPSAHLFFVGRDESDHRRSLELMASTLRISERVSFCGEVGTLNGLYNAADLVVQSSTNEGSSNVLREALACGCRCVATDVGDARELSGDIRVVPARDYVALANAMSASVRSDPVERVAALDGFSTPEQLADETLRRLGLC